jgi:hypothetical protein
MLQCPDSQRFLQIFGGRISFHRLNEGAGIGELSSLPNGWNVVESGNSRFWTENEELPFHQ